MTDEHLALGLVYPPQSSILATSQAVAMRVAESIVSQGLAGVDTPSDLAAHVAACSWRPEYSSLD